MDTLTQPTRKSLRICMLAYTHYETDARVRRYGESLAERGDEVDAVCLRTGGISNEEEDVIKGVHIHRIQDRTYDEKGKWSYLNRLLQFFIKSVFFITRENFKNRYDLIHVHNIPDFLVFSSIFPKFFGSKIILDIHDVLPEFYSNKFKTSETGLVFKAMTFIEKISTSFSNHVIISNHLWEKTLISRSVKRDKLTVLINFPDETSFFPRPVSHNNGRLIMIYPGTLNWHQGLDISIRAFALTKDKIPNLDFYIYGTGSTKTDLEELIKELGLGERVILKDPVSMDQIPEVMAGADFGVVPKRDDSFGGEAFSTKILEFMAIGIPAVVSKTKVDRYYFNDSVVKFFTPGDERDLANCIIDLALNKEEREQIAVNGQNFVRDLMWGKNKQKYLDLVDSLVYKSQGFHLST